MADSSLNTVAEDRAPLLNTASFNHALRSPVKLDEGAASNVTATKRAREGEEDESEVVEDDFFAGHALPTSTSQASSIWSQSSSSPPIAGAKVSRVKKAYRPPIGTSSPIAPTTTRASASRPLFQERSNVVSPSKEGRRSASGTKKQLMPTIPARKESATSIETLGGRSKSSTNIQTLAQAIAARAQHVAAANALAKASNLDDPSSNVADIDTKLPDLVAPVPVAAATLGLPSDNSETNQRASVPIHAEEDELQRQSNILGLSALATKPIKDQTSRDSAYTVDGSRWNEAGWNVVQELDDKKEVLEGTAVGDMDSSGDNNGRHKTSDSDGSVSTGPTSHAEHSQSALISIAMNGQGRGNAKSRTSSNGHELQLDGLQSKAASSSPPRATRAIDSSSLDGYATAKDATSSISNLPNSDASEVPFPATSPNNDSLHPSSSLSRGKRKSRPTYPSPKTPASTSVARGPISPSKTPPPTMPPLEPLPPVPPTSSNAYQKVSSIHRRLSGSRNSGPDSSSPLIAAFTAMASKNPRSRLQSDPSPNKMQFNDDNFSMPQSSPVQQSTSALVSASNATTLAEAENAQAILSQITTEPSFNEKRASLRALAREKSLKRSINPAEAVPIIHSKQLDQANELNKSTAIVTKNDSELPYEQDGNGDEKHDSAIMEETDSVVGEDEEEEEAVLTRVTSVTSKPAVMPNDKPRLIRTDSSTTARSFKGAQSDEAAAATTASRNVVGSGRSQMAAGESKEESSTIRQTAGPPSAWNSRPVDRPTISAITGGPSTMPQISRDQRNSIADTQSDIHNSGGTWSVQGTDEDLSTSSPALERVKRAGTASSFGEITSAFRQLQAEKRVLEKVIRATTPFAGVGNGEDLSQYLTSLSSKLALSTAEIKRLLDLLDQQRNIMNYMVETHQLECEAYQEEINELNEDLEAVEIEADTHRSNCIRFTEEIDRAQGSLADEVSKRDHFTFLLQSARGELARMEDERAQAVQARTEEVKAHSVTRSALQSAQNEHAAELQSQKETLEVALLSLRAYKSGSVTPEVREAELTSHTSDATMIADLQRQLNESKSREAESERQLQEMKLATHAKSHDEEMSVGSLSPLIEGSNEVEEALRDKLLQQEQDIAELRAAVALGGGVGGTKEGQLASVSESRSDQVQKLLADLADKRAREAQIRSAYKQVRDELRKMQLSQQQDRRRSQASYNYLTNIATPGGGGGSSSSSHGHGIAPPSSYFGALNIDSSAPSTPDGITKEGVASPTARNLKRLSLPLVTKQGNSLNGLQHLRTTAIASYTHSPMSTDGHGNSSSLKKDTIQDADDESMAQYRRDAPFLLSEEQIESMVAPSTP